MSGKLQKISLYDWVRLLATIMVVVGHSAYYSMYTALGGVGYTLPVALSPVYDSFIFKSLRFVAIWVYGFHMPLFFFLSGAVLALKPIGQTNSFLMKKARNLILPFFTAGLLFMLPVKYLSGFYTNESILPAIGLFIGGVDESGHLWFLWALFWVMAIFAIVQKILEKFTNNSPVLLLIITWLIQMNASNVTVTAFQFSASLKYIFWFALGFIFEKHFRDRLSLKLSGILFTFVGILEILHATYSMFTTETVIILGILLTVSLSHIFSVVFAKLYDTAVFKVLFRNLFSIYLYHDPLEYVVLKFTFQTNLLESDAGCWFYLFARTIGVTLLSILIGELLRTILKVFKNKKEVIA